MKIVVEFQKNGIYRDHYWEGYFHSVKGQLREVTPSYAAQLIKESKATLYVKG
jgi:hypothetical protein